MRTHTPYSSQGLQLTYPLLTPPPLIHLLYYHSTLRHTTTPHPTPLLTPPPPIHLIHHHSTLATPHPTPHHYNPTTTLLPIIRYTTLSTHPSPPRLTPNHSNLTIPTMGITHAYVTTELVCTTTLLFRYSYRRILYFSYPRL